MAVFILAVIVNNYNTGQVRCGHSGVLFCFCEICALLSLILNPQIDTCFWG